MSADAVRWPLYYLPPGMARPVHLVHMGGVGVAAHVGPDDAAEDERGGRIYGSAWDDRTRPLWKRTQAGWWVAMGDALPMHLSRIVPMEGDLVPGAKPGQSWLVPRLLRWRDGFGLVSAVPAEFRDYQWQPPQHLEAMMIKLRCMFYWEKDGPVPEVPDEEAVGLAVQILALNYHITLHELTTAGWISDVMVLTVLRTAAGMDYADG